MTDVIKVEYVDDVNIRLICEPGIAQEVSDYFTFFVPGYKFMAKFKAKMWDGKIRLFNPFTCLLYGGLLRKLAKFCKDREYVLVIPKRFADVKFEIKDAKSFVEDLAPTMTPHDHQYDAFIKAVQKRRALLLSPTSSGKSFIIYLLCMYYKVPTLIVVPTTSLVNQMYSDFEEYGLDSDRYVHKIYSGHDKNTDKPIVVTTWQSVYQLPQKWFSRYKLAIGDEAHGFKAKSLTSIMTKLVDCPYRIGLTGTLDGTETNELVLEGLFGPVHRVISTKELMDKGIVAKLSVEAIVLVYTDETKKHVSKHLTDYKDEIEFIVTCKARNEFIKKLALSLKGNSLLLFQYVEKHGKVLYELIKAVTDRPVYFIAGETDVDDRERIRKILETETDAIAICSSGTFSTGVSVKNLHNVIFTSPSKSRIKVLQSIGRGLRVSKTKTEVTLYDLSDDLTWKSRENHTTRHFVERVKLYNEENFDYRIHRVKLSA